MGYFLGIIAKGVSHNDIFKGINPREYANGNFQTDFLRGVCHREYLQGVNSKVSIFGCICLYLCSRE